MNYEARLQGYATIKGIFTLKFNYWANRVPEQPLLDLTVENDYN